MFPFIQIKSKITKKADHAYLPSDSGQKKFMEETKGNKEKIDIMRR